MRIQFAATLLLASTAYAALTITSPAINQVCRFFSEFLFSFLFGGFGEITWPERVDCSAALGTTGPRLAFPQFSFIATASLPSSVSLTRNLTLSVCSAKMPPSPSRAPWETSSSPCSLPTTRVTTMVSSSKGDSRTEALLCSMSIYQPERP